MQLTSLPLHPAQEDVYVDQVLNIDSPHYNIGGYIRIKGSLHKETFYQVVNTLPLVFDAYRMRFDLIEMDSLCYFDADYNRLEVPESDFSIYDDPAGEAEAWMQNRFNTVLLKEKDNLPFEHCLIKIAPDEHWFFCRYHHLITDGYGFIVFVQYIARKYKSLITNDQVQFNYPSYYEEALKAQEYRGSATGESDRKYWSDKINENPKKFLQKKYELAHNPPIKSAVFNFNISTAQRAELNELQNVTNSSLQQLTIAALLIYFGKTSEQTEFLFGIPVHKRGSRQLRNVFGMLGGILPFKASFQENLTITNLLKEIAFWQKKDYRHYNFPIGDISKNLKTVPSESSLTDVTINYELLDFKIVFDEQIEATVLQITSEYGKNPLQISWRDYGTQQPLQLHIKSRNEYLSRQEIELLAQRIIYIIQQFTDDLNNSAGSIHLMPCSERKLLEGFNNSFVEYANDKSIVNLFEEQVSCTPDAVAVVFAKDTLSYRQLNERSNKLAHYLKGKGVKQEMLVPLCVYRSIEMIVGILGILKAGGGYVPIDPDYPEERIRYIIEDTGARLIICSAHSRVKLHRELEDTLVVVDIFDEDISEQHLDTQLPTIQPDHLAYVIYTSGSTGKPKGVLIEHGGLVNLIMAQSSYFNITGNEKVLQFSNFCFDASVEQIFIALLNGATLILFEEGLQLNIALFESFLKENYVSHLHATPSFLENLYKVDYPHLKRVIAGGDVCKKELSSRWKNKVDFYNEYGPTETTVTAIEYKDNNESLEQCITVPIGRPVANTFVYILNKRLELCPIGMPGEIYIGGAQIARGYLNRPELTAEKFVSDLYSKNPGTRMYKTGDIGKWLADGNIEYMGRIDEQVKIRGYRIEPGEIENVLEQSDVVQKAVVLAKDDKEGNKRLIGYVVPVGIFNKEAIIDYLRGKLPEYMIPAIWVELESLGLTVNGKIDKKALPDPDISVIIRNEYKDPSNEMEAELIEIWKELLHVDKVGILDNFFELGGHSLKAIQLISRLHKQFNIKIDIKKIFSYPTIKELCEILPVETQYQYKEIQRLPEQDTYELSHAQKRMWFFSHFQGGSLAYSVPTAYILEGFLQMDALQMAFDLIIERHEILRTVFVEINGEPRQKILSSLNDGLILELIDVSGSTDVNAIIKNAIELESSQHFDLTKAPLLKASLFRETPEKHIIVFNIHHIICDGWSKGILIREILLFYKNFSTGIASKLAPLPIQYKDYAAWQAASTTAQGSYWRNVFSKDIPVLTFPLDFERQQSISFSGAKLLFTLHESLTLNLQNMATRFDITLNSLLLSLYGMWVAHYCQQDEVVIGSLTSGRNHADLENLVGVFINFLPIRLSVNDRIKLPEYLKQSHHVLLEAYVHQDYPFDLMVNDCIRERDISRNPFFDTMINFHWENDRQHDIQMAGSQLNPNGILIKPYPLAEEDFFHSVLDFMLDIDPFEGRLDLYLSYNVRLFTKERMSGFLEGFVELLENIIREPDKHVYEYVSIAAIKQETLPVHTAETVSPGELSVIICSSFVAEPIQEYLEYWSNEFELHINLAFAPYNQVFQQLLNPDSMINNNKGINVLFIRIDDWLPDKKDQTASDQVNFLNQIYLEFIRAIDHIRSINVTHYMIAVVPHSASLSLHHEVAARITEISSKIEFFLKQIPDFYLLNLPEIASLYSVEEIFDPVSDKLGHMPFTPEFYAALGTFLSRKIRAYRGNAYKILAVDCDNTLWSGICGEVGAINVAIDKNFSYLQKFLLDKYNEGFLLTLCSKNNEDDVWEVFDRHPDMIIKREHIAAYRLNWNPKHENLTAIAKELNVGLDSLIFIDDSNFEVEQMSVFCSEVLSLALPADSNDFFNFLNHIWALDRFQITAEDWQRNSMYKAEKLRKEEQVKYHMFDDFLQSLNILINIRPLQRTDLQRAVQLSQRTNQFNLNGIRWASEDIMASIGNSDSLNWIIEVKDRFGDYGIVGLLLAAKTQKSLVVKSFMLSCRVLGRNVEDHMLTELQRYCVIHNLNIIEVQFNATGKNKPFIEFLLRTDWIRNQQTNTYSLLIKNISQELQYINSEKHLIE